MKIVIDISEERFNSLKAGFVQHGSIAEKMIVEAVRNGTPLQKGHDRLVYVDECKGKMLKYGFRAPDMTVTEFVEDMLTTIIPADKEW